jgi:hypothetical protein
MQTFLPYPDFAQSAKVLDTKRLGKQRVECLQLLNSITGKTTGRGWTNHPARDMWRPYVPALIEYGIVICKEWQGRNFNDTCLLKIQSFSTGQPIEYPWWLGDSKFHHSHKSNLLRKNYEYYSRYFPDVEDNHPYIWPVNATKTFKII